MKCPPFYIADAGPDAVVVYVQDGSGGPVQEHARYERTAGDDPEQLLANNGWHRVREWRHPHEQPDHQVAQVTTWT